MAGVRGKRRQPSRAMQADPEAARRSKREREEAPAVKPPTSTLSTPTLTVETMHLSLAYNLRNRKVFVPNEEKPGQPVYSKGEQIMYDTSSKTPVCPEGTAEAVLEHYNRLNEDEHELVKAVDWVTFYFTGPWMHVNFLARLKGGTTCVELVPKYFFAELSWDLNKNGYSSLALRWTQLILKQHLFAVVGFAQAGFSILLLADTEEFGVHIVLAVTIMRKNPLLKQPRPSLMSGSAKYSNRKNIVE